MTLSTSDCRRLLLERLGRVHACAPALRRTAAHFRLRSLPESAKCTEQLHLPLRKRAGLRFANKDRAHRFAIAQHRNRYGGPPTPGQRHIRGRTQDPRACRAHRAILPSNIARPAATKRSRPLGICLDNAVEDFGGEIMVGCIVKEIAVIPPDQLYTASHRREALSQNRIENRLGSWSANG